jgi:hypothetical protein
MEVKGEQLLPMTLLAIQSFAISFHSFHFISALLFKSWSQLIVPSNIPSNGTIVSIINDASISIKGCGWWEHLA